MATSNRLREYAPHPPAQRESPFAGGFLLATLGTLVLGAAIGIGGYFLFSGKKEPDISEAVRSATAPRETPQPTTAPDATPQPTPAPLPVADDGSWTEADLKRCGEEAAAAREAASKRKLAAVSADRVGLGAPDPKMVERAAFLLCSARTKPRHLCQSYWHGKLLAAIRVYATEFSTVATSAYWTKVTLAERVRAGAGANQEELRVMAEDIDQTTRDVAKMHEEIVAALRALVANGILAKDEFGKFFGLGVPPDIAKMLGDGPALRQVCG